MKKSIISFQSADEKIIELLCQREMNGMSMLYDKYSGAISNVILRVVHCQEISEEVLQDTFTKAWRNFDKYDTSKGQLFTWLINIARNTAIDATRKKSFSRKIQPLENVVHTIDHLQSTAINTETIDLRELTKKLSVDHTNLIDLIYFQGYTQAEAAEALNIPLGTVKTRVKIAITRLKEFYSV